MVCFVHTGKLELGDNKLPVNGEMKEHFFCDAGAGDDRNACGLWQMQDAQYFWQIIWEAVEDDVAKTVDKSVFVIIVNLYLFHIFFTS